VTGDPVAGIRMLEGTIPYADGSEGYLLDVLRRVSDRSSDSDELAASIRDWPSRYHLSPMRGNLLLPLTLAGGQRVLDVGAGTGAISRALAEGGAEVVALEGTLERAQALAARCADLDTVEVVCGAIRHFSDDRGFDLICLVGVLEYAGAELGGAEGPSRLLARLERLLRPGGALLVAIENQLGLKYLVGFTEDHLGVPWVGVEGYPGEAGVRTYSRRELAELLSSSGFVRQRWLYPFPDYKLPRVILAHAAYEQPDTVDLVDQLVREPCSAEGGQRTLLCDERLAHRVLLRSGLGPEVANSFLVLAGRRDADLDRRVAPDVLAWLGAGDRRRQWRRHQVVTVDGSGRRVTARLERPEEARRSAAWLTQRRPKDLPYFTGPTVEQLLLDACRCRDVKRLEDLLRRWRDRVLEHVQPEPGPGVNPFRPGGDPQVLPPRFLDVCPSNFVVTGDGLEYVDDEWEAEGGVEASLALGRALWLFARDLVQLGRVHPWGEQRTVDEVCLALAEAGGLRLQPEALPALRAAEASLQALLTGRDPTALREGLDWVGRHSQVRAGDEAWTALPLAVQVRDALALRREYRALEQKIESLREAHHRLLEHRDWVLGQYEALVPAREQLERQLAAVTGERDVAWAELHGLREQRLKLESRLLFRCYRAVQRLLGR